VSLVESPLSELESNPALALKLAERLNVTISLEILENIARLREDFGKMFQRIARAQGVTFLFLLGLLVFFF
jgi:hypothetical protein